MGSLLNFVFLKNTCEYNGDETYAMQGPIFYYIERKNYSYTINSEIKVGYKNILLIEGNKIFESLLNIPDNIYDFIQNNDIKLLFTSIPDPTDILTFINACNYLKTKLPKEKYHLIDSNTRLPDIFTFDFFVEEAVFNKDQNFLDELNPLGYISEEIHVNELDKFRNKKFLCFNRNIDKPHRISLLYEYLNNNYTDSYFTFLMKTENYAKRYGEYMNNKGIKAEYFNKHIPIELDTQNVSDKSNFNSTNTFKKELFLNSCINLVTETSFERNELFISEKVFKPIINYQPFIVLSAYGYLKKLRSYGFKTFSDFWDESYDYIENPDDRFKKLLQIIRELNSKTIEELNELYKNVKHICIHNKQVFDSLEIDTLEKILKNIENEW
jgi:hypothetical protein